MVPHLPNTILRIGICLAVASVLLTYSPDLNPIEEFFAELKAFIKKNWHALADAPEQGFDVFLE
jgi:transposase